MPWPQAAPCRLLDKLTRFTKCQDCLEPDDTDVCVLCNRCSFCSPATGCICSSCPFCLEPIVPTVLGGIGLKFRCQELQCKKQDRSRILYCTICKGDVTQEGRNHFRQHRAEISRKSKSRSRGSNTKTVSRRRALGKRKWEQMNSSKRESRQ